MSSIMKGFNYIILFSTPNYYGHKLTFGDPRLVGEHKPIQFLNKVCTY